jgi:hypothetical protein
MDEVATAADFGPRHLPQIVACDLPAGRYLWIPDERRGADDKPVNHYGGAFWEVAWLQRVAKTRGESDRIRALNQRLPRAPKDGVDLDALVAYLQERGLSPAVPDRSARA